MVVGSETVEVAPAASFLYIGTDRDAIQNGKPDGVALLDWETGELIDALSYEGEIPAATIETNAGVGEYDLVETEVPVFGDSSSVEGSLVRIPNGSDTDWAYLDWMFTGQPTPGSENIYVSLY